MDPETAAEIRSLSNGMRALFVVLVLIPCLINGFVALCIGSFEAIYADMLGGKPLPTLSMLVIAGRIPLLMLAGGLPVGAIAVAAGVRNHQAAFYTIAALIIVAGLQMVLVLAGLFLPLITIISGMQDQS